MGNVPRAPRPGGPRAQGGPAPPPKRKKRKKEEKEERDAQRQYMVIGTLAPNIIEFLLLCSDWGSGPEGGDVLLN